MTYPLLCEDTLHQLSEDIGAELLPELFSVFIEENQPQLETLETQGLPSDLTQVQGLFHTLKSSAASYGGLRLAHLATQLDVACKQQDHQCIQALFDDFLAVYRQTLSILRQRF